MTQFISDKIINGAQAAIFIIIIQSVYWLDVCGLHNFTLHTAVAFEWLRSKHETYVRFSKETYTLIWKLKKKREIAFVIKTKEIT